MADQNPEDLLNTSTPKLTKENEDGKFNRQPEQPSKIPTVVNQNSPNQQNMILPGTKKVFLSKNGKIIGAQLVHQQPSKIPTVVNQNSPNQQNMIQPGIKKVFFSKNGKIIGAQLVHQPTQTNANSANDTGKIAISAFSFYR